MMKTGLEHLPEKKQRELARVVGILHEEFADALAGSETGWKKKGRILKIILFGSYARGGWVEEPHTMKGYKSDFDLLIVVNNRKLSDFATYWHKAADRFLHERGIKTPVSFIVHSRREVKEALRKGQYFFVDIRKQGIVLYELDDEALPEPRPLTPQDAYEAAKEHFEERLPLAGSFLETARSLANKKEKHHLKHAAFQLHQSIEQAYTALLLTLTNYSPPAHNIKFLRSLAEDQERDLVAAWPRDLPRERAWFNTLVEAYVKARYSKHFKIDAEALVWLGERTEHLHVLVEAACKKHLAKLAREAGIE